MYSTVNKTSVYRDQPKTYLAAPGTIKCQKRRAPEQAGPYTVIVSLQKDADYIPSLFTSPDNTSLTNSYPLHLNARPGNLYITLIQTDKPVYKPGQTVKFRILRLNRNFRPDIDKIKAVHVKSPADIRIMQWKDVPTTHGIASLEMVLSNDPPLGTWSIKAIYNDSKEYSNTFSVEEYGNMTILRGLEGSANKRLKQINGCYKVTVDASRVNSEGNLQINASVTEEGTGVIVSSQYQGPGFTHVYSTLKIIDENRGYFKQGLPYRGKVTAKNPMGNPIPQERIRIKASTYQMPWHLTLTVNTDENGTAFFAINNFPENITTFSISAVGLSIQNEDGEQYPRHYLGSAHKNVRRWFSPSDSYIQIEHIQQPLACGKDSQLGLLYSTPNDTNLNFYIMVMSRGRIIYATNKKHQYTVGDSHQTTFTDPHHYLQMQIVPTATSIATNCTEGTCCDGVCLDDGVKRSNLVGRVQISLPITAAFAPESQVIVYYVRTDGEVVSSFTRLEVENCFDNKVNIEFVKSPIKPGSNATIRVSGDPGSACSIGVVDKSIDLLKADHELTAEKFYSKIRTTMFSNEIHHRNIDSFDVLSIFNKRKNCDQKETENGAERYKNMRMDSFRSFQNVGLHLLTNLKLKTKPCVQHTPSFGHFAKKKGRGIPSEAKKKGRGIPSEAKKIDRGIPSEDEPTIEKVRQLFPETWLWELQIIGDSGENTLVRRIPDTITEWKGSALCMNSASGLGISSISSVTAFQPFFLSFTLPYSAVRNEVVPVLVTVFNYLTQCLVMKVSLRDSEEFRLQNTIFMKTKTVCVCGGESETLRYLIIPLKIGEISIQAEAESIADEGTCGNSSVSSDATGVSDAVRRQLPVEAEGLENEYTYSSFVCVSGEHGTLTENIQLQLPLNRIQDSERGFMNIIGDVMGPALKNLKGLLKMPYGCGEQNMAAFAPNIFLLQYLYNNKMDVSRVLDDALRYMRAGYQRQLKYRHKDGSYSAFGETDGRSGSTWLTAFVVKCLGQSQKYIAIDQTDLYTSIAWFKRQQNEFGCFPKVGYTHSYYLKGGWGKSNDEEGTLTAFVLIAMLEAGLPKNDLAVQSAIRCLDRQDVKDTYLLTLMAYAYSLYDINSARRLEIMFLLRSKMKRIGTDMIYWSRYPQPKEQSQDFLNFSYKHASSAEVEMTSYALLALTIGSQSIAAGFIVPIVMWLTRQRNAQGGFSSTQDTVIALQALSVYGSLQHNGETNVNVEVIGDQMSSTYNISNENRLILQTVPILRLPNALNVTVRGVGCALVQANVKYNTPKVKADPDFALNVSIRRFKQKHSHCSKRIINICASYNGSSGRTKMAIADVKMQTGWIPVISDDIKNTTGLQKYEIDGNVVHFYFEHFDAEQKCFNLDVEQEIELKDPQPAYVKIYDYYETDSSVTKEYDMITICETPEKRSLSKPSFMQLQVPFRHTDIAQKPRCPVCTELIDTESEEFRDLVCNSTRVFGAVKSRPPQEDGVFEHLFFITNTTQRLSDTHLYVFRAYKDRKRVSIYRSPEQRLLSMKRREDLNDTRREYIPRLIRYQMYQECICDHLYKIGVLMVIFDTKDQFNELRNELSFTETTTIIRSTPEIIRKVFLPLRRKCGIIP
eukprot:XP_011447751.1 PREDICTED: pregnancy zone protein [Crassostrea gigas]